MARTRYQVDIHILGSTTQDLTNKGMSINSIETKRSSSAVSRGNTNTTNRYIGSAQ